MKRDHLSNYRQGPGRNRTKQKILWLAPWLLFSWPAFSQTDAATNSPENAAGSERCVSCPAGLPSSFAALVAKEGPAVVNISSVQAVKDQTPDEDAGSRFPPWLRRAPSREPQVEAISQGSGFIISASGEILTNAHVVGDADQVQVTLMDKRSFRGKVLGTDPSSDIALVKIDAEGLPTVSLGDSSGLRVGDWVVAIGTPFGLENTVTQGIVSGLGRSLPEETYVPFIQTDVPVNPGSSGGPLFDLQGKVVGINAQIFSQTGGYMGLSFAVPIKTAMDVAKQLREHGLVRRGWLGVAIQNLNQQLASAFGRSDANGALVVDVKPGGPAQKAGIGSGDIVITVEDKPITNATDLPRMVAAIAPGDRVSLGVWHKRALKTITVDIGDLPLAQTAPKPAIAPSGKPSSLGLALDELSDRQKQRAGIDHGVLVRNVDPAAARAGLQVGDVILAINEVPVKNVAGFQALLQQNTANPAIALLLLRNGNSFYLPLGR